MKCDDVQPEKNSEKSENSQFPTKFKILLIRLRTMPGLNEVFTECQHCCDIIINDYVRNTIRAFNIKTKLVPNILKMKSVSNHLKIQPNVRLNIQTQKMLSVISTLFPVSLSNCECI